MSEVDSTEKKIAMDEVAEKRPAPKKKGFLGTIIFLVIIVGSAGAAWYFQSMWLPQVQETYQQAKTKVNDFISPKKVDPMAAPAMVEIEATPSDKKSEYVVSAITDPVKTVAEPDEKVMPVVPAIPVEEPVTENVDSETSTVEPVKSEVLEEINAQEEVKTKQEADVKTESVAQATFVDEAAITKSEPDLPKATETTEPVAVPEMATDKSLEKDKAVSSKENVVVDLAAARQAFWHRDLPRAEALYKQQIEIAKATADSWGELGNIYYLQAKWQQAASAYTEAALILLDKGDFPQAMFMRYIVVGLDPAQAKRIDEHVRALQAPVNG